MITKKSKARLIGTLITFLSIAPTVTYSAPTGILQCVAEPDAITCVRTHEVYGQDKPARVRLAPIRVTLPGYKMDAKAEWSLYLMLCAMDVPRD